MKLTIIIPTYNRRDNIIRTLDCLSRQVIDSAHTVKIIVVDDGSNDGSEEVILGAYRNQNNITFIKRPREHDWNASVPRNLGARAADPDTDCFYFLDSDVMLPANRVQRLIDDWMGNPDQNRVIIGPYHYMKNPFSVNSLMNQDSITNYDQDIRWKSFEEHPVEEVNKGVGFALACFGGSLLIPRALFFKTGGYDEKVTSGCEDGDFGLTLWEAGAVFSLDKELLGWHHSHEILPSRTASIKEMVAYIDEKHRMDLIQASGEAYRQWGVNWTPPDTWV